MSRWAYYQVSKTLVRIKLDEILNFIYSILFVSWAPVAHTYNPSYSGARGQEDGDSKPALDK
jgi:hypothetical protein